MAIFPHAPALQGERRSPESALWMGQRLHGSIGSIHLIYWFWNRARICRPLAGAVCLRTQADMWWFIRDYLHIDTPDRMHEALREERVLAIYSGNGQFSSCLQSSHLFSSLEDCRWPSRNPAKSAASRMPLRHFVQKTASRSVQSSSAFLPHPKQVYILCAVL